MPSLASKIESAMIAKQVDMLRVEAGLQKEVRGLIKGLAKELTDLIKSIDPTDVTRNSARQARMIKLVGGSKPVIDHAYRGMKKQMSDDLKKLVVIEQEAMLAGINNAVGFGLANKRLGKEVLEAIAGDILIQGGTLIEWGKSLAGTAKQQFANEMRMGMLAGEGLNDLLRRVRGRRENGFKDGFVERASRNAEKIVRTAIAEVNGKARLALLEANDDVIDAVEWSSTLDNRTSPQCQSLSGQSWDINTHKPEEGSGSFPGPPPIHWNSLAEGSLIQTKRGKVAIENIRNGDKVLTHKGRYRRVTATMLKRNDTDFIKRFKTNTGRMLLATDEHPILSVGEGWKCAGDIQVGDEVFEHKHKSFQSWFSHGGLSVPYDYPSLFHQQLVAYEIVSMPVCPLVAFPVNLKNHLVLWKGKIHNSVIYDKLKFGFIAKAIPYSPFPFGRLCTKRCSERNHSSGLNFVIVHGIGLGHALTMRFIHGVRFFGESISPMINTAWCGVEGKSVMSRFAFASHGDAKLIASIENTPRGNIKHLGNITRRFFINKVFSLKKFFGEHWQTPQVTDIDNVAYTGTVYNLSVDEDESYVADGIVVHNCRSMLIPVLKPLGELSDNPRIRKKLSKTRYESWTRASGWKDPKTGKITGKAVSGRMSYDDWLHSLSEAKQRQALGAGRYDLWKAGKITSVRQLANQSHRPYTVAQLQEKYGIVKPPKKPPGTGGAPTVVANVGEPKNIQLHEGASRYVLSHKTSNKREFAYVYDENGLVLKRPGKKRSVGFTPSEVAGFKGKTIVHNHPSGESLSGADYWMTHIGEMDGVYAVTLDGSEFFGKVGKKITHGVFTKTKNLVDDAIFTELDSLVFKGEINRIVAKRIHSHLRGLVFSDIGLAEYKMTKTGSIMGKAIADITPRKLKYLRSVVAEDYGVDKWLKK